MFSEKISELINKRQRVLDLMKWSGVVSILWIIPIVYAVMEYSDKYPLKQDGTTTLQICIVGSAVLVVLFLLYHVAISGYLFKRSYNKPINSEKVKTKLEEIFLADDVKQFTEEDLKFLVAFENYYARIKQFFILNVVAVVVLGIILSLYSIPFLSVIFAFYGILLTFWVCQKMAPRLGMFFGNNKLFTESKTDLQ